MGSKRNPVIVLIAAAASSVVLIFIIAMLFLWFYLQRKRRNSARTRKNPPALPPLTTFPDTAAAPDAHESAPGLHANGMLVGRQFTLEEIRVATKDFDESLLIGVGGFGKVYRGEIEGGTVVAIKRGSPQSQQGTKEFETEIHMLSRVRHQHLVSLIGYCDQQGEMVLVYEHMANGTLRSHLYGCANTALTWKQRLEACIGAARGIHYLHTGVARGIIHRDVKTTNILLDRDFVAKMSDFGISKFGPAIDHTHVSTLVKGSFGYLDPEYFRRQRLTQNSDVYSFGVVLYEVLCARPVIDPTLPTDQINLAEWALRRQKQKLLETILDPRLKGDCSAKSMKIFSKIAEKCLADEGRNRPSMGQVLWHLETALQLHEEHTQRYNAHV